MSVSAAVAIFRMNKLGGESAPMFRSRSGIKEKLMRHGAVQWKRNFEIGSLYCDAASSASFTITIESKMWDETVQDKPVKSKLHNRYMAVKKTTRV
jgi:hypothetical protein